MSCPLSWRKTQVDYVHLLLQSTSSLVLEATFIAQLLQHSLPQPAVVLDSF